MSSVFESLYGLFPFVVSKMTTWLITVKLSSFEADVNTQQIIWARGHRGSGEKIIKMSQVDWN